MPKQRVMRHDPATHALALAFWESYLGLSCHRLNPAKENCLFDPRNAIRLCLQSCVCQIKKTTKPC